MHLYNPILLLQWIVVACLLTPIDLQASTGSPAQLLALNGSPRFDGEVCVAQDSDRTLIANSDYHSDKGLTIWSIQRDSNDVTKYIDGIKLDAGSRVPEDDSTYTSPQKIHGIFLANGRLFVCAWNTLWVLDNDNGHWTARYIDIENHGEIISDSVYDIKQFGSRTLIATYEGLYQLGPGSSQPTAVRGTADVVITCITVIGHRAYLGGSSAYTLDEGANQAKPIASVAGLQAICFAQVGPRLFIAGAPTDVQPTRIAVLEDNQPLKWITMDKPNCWITDIAATSDNRTYIATNQGILRVDDHSNVPQLYLNCGDQSIFGLPMMQCAGDMALGVIQNGKSTRLWNVSNNSEMDVGSLSNNDVSYIRLEGNRFLVILRGGVVSIAFSIPQ